MDAAPSNGSEARITQRSNQEMEREIVSRDLSALWDENVADQKTRHNSEGGKDADFLSFYNFNPYLCKSLVFYTWLFRDLFLFSCKQETEAHSVSSG